MATLLQQGFTEKPVRMQFNLDLELRMHGWYPAMTYLEAEKALKDKPIYTYLLRKSQTGRTFEISFVQPDGTVKHDLFTLIDPIHGMWRNGHPTHVGTLSKVIRDMMDCSMHEGQPL